MLVLGSSGDYQETTSDSSLISRHSRYGVQYLQHLSQYLQHYSALQYIVPLPASIPHLPFLFFAAFLVESLPIPCCSVLFCSILFSCRRAVQHVSNLYYFLFFRTFVCNNRQYLSSISLLALSIFHATICYSTHAIALHCIVLY